MFGKKKDDLNPVSIPCDLFGFDDNEDAWDCRGFDYKVFTVKKGKKFSISKNLSDKRNYKDMIIRLTASRDMLVLCFEGKAWFHLGYTKEKKIY